MDILNNKIIYGVRRKCHKLMTENHFFKKCTDFPVRAMSRILAYNNLLCLMHIYVKYLVCVWCILLCMYWYMIYFMLALDWYLCIMCRTQLCQIGPEWCWISQYETFQGQLISTWIDCDKYWNKCFDKQTDLDRNPWWWVTNRDVKFGLQIGSDWSQMGQIWDILRSVSVHFGAPRHCSTYIYYMTSL